MKYIDADRLLAFLQKKLESYKSNIVDPSKFPIDHIDLMALLASEYQALIIQIDSLQQEQPEVDLEKETEKYFKGWTETDEGIACHYQYVDLNTCRGIAHHFFELGLKAGEK